jgi:hypothetical protein
MTTPGRAPTSGSELWKRLLRRYAFGRTLQRPRVPIVLFRRRLPAEREAARPPAPHQISHQHVAVHVHLSWPGWLGPSRTATDSAAQPAIARTVFRRTAGRLSPSAMATHISPGLVTADLAGPPSIAARVQPSREATAAAASPAVVRPDARATDSLRPRGSPGSTTARRIFARTLVERRQTAIVRASGTAIASASPHRRPAAGETGRAVGRRAPTGHVAVEARRREPARLAPAPVRQLPAQQVAPGIATSTVAPATVVAGSFPRPVSRTFAMPAPDRPATGSQPHPVASAPTASSPAPRPAAQPPLDVARLSEDVYRHIQRRLRIERERQGL